MFIACGTSFHACLAARQTVEELCDLPVVSAFYYLVILGVVSAGTCV
jgi:glucosamine 6-phosphate synthetase-like amidotransferase/phosphosugar isomerase protein